MLNSSIIPTPVVLCFIALFLIYWVYFSRMRSNKLPPGPHPKPIVGNLLELVFGRDPCTALTNLSKKYGPIFSMDFGSYPVLILQNHEVIRKCFNQHAFSGRPKYQIILERDGGITRGIGNTELSTWIEQRRFAIRNLRDFGFGKKTMEIMIQEDATKLIDRLEKSSGTPISTRDIFCCAVMGSMWRLIAGVEVDENDPEINNAFSLVKISGSSDFTGVSFFFPKFAKTFSNICGYSQFLNNQLGVKSFIEGIVKECKKTYKDGVERHLIDTYFKEINNTTDPNSSFYGEEGAKQMVVSLLDLFQAGSETTSTTLTWAFLILALYPEIQDKLHKEIDAVVIGDVDVSLEDRNRMPYTECFLMEVLRHGSIIPLGIFRSTTTDTVVNDYNVSRETVVIPNLRFALNDSNVWSDPDNIRPERFMLKDGTVDRQNPAWIPFSVGKRVCLGEKLAKDELFIFTVSICKNFRIEIDKSRPKPTLEAITGVIRSPKEHRLVLQKRGQ